MKAKARKITILNYFTTTILLILGVLTFVCNVLGLWTLWHLIGFSYLFFSFIEGCVMLLAFIHCYLEQNKKIRNSNIILLIINIVIFLFTINVSMTWLW